MNGICAICKLTRVGPGHFHTDGHLSKQAVIERREDRQDPQLILLPDLPAVLPKRKLHGS